MSRRNGDTTISLVRVTSTTSPAGEISVVALVRYEWPDGRSEDTTQSCVGSTYGGPVLATATAEMTVTEPSQYGPFVDDPVEWMRRFVLDER